MLDIIITEEDKLGQYWQKKINMNSESKNREEKEVKRYAKEHLKVFTRCACLTLLLVSGNLIASLLITNALFSKIFLISSVFSLVFTHFIRNTIFLLPGNNWFLKVLSSIFFTALVNSGCLIFGVSLIVTNLPTWIGTLGLSLMGVGVLKEIFGRIILNFQYCIAAITSTNNSGWVEGSSKESNKHVNQYCFEDFKPPYYGDVIGLKKLIPDDVAIQSSNVLN